MTFITWKLRLAVSSQDQRCYKNEEGLLSVESSFCQQSVSFQGYVIWPGTRPITESKHGCKLVLYTLPHIHELTFVFVWPLVSHKAIPLEMPRCGLSVFASQYESFFHCCCYTHWMHMVRKHNTHILLVCNITILRFCCTVSVIVKP